MGILMLALSYFDFNFLVQFYTLLRIFNLLCEFAALVWLRNIYPDADREFKIPGETFGLFLLIFPTVALSFAVVITADWSALLSGAVTIVFFMIVWPVWLLLVRVCDLASTIDPQNPTSIN